MQKIIELFKDISFEEFLRIILSDNSLTLIHINKATIINKIDVDLIDKIRIFEYIKERLSLPLEVIISSNTMSCRSVALDRLNEKSLIALANNVIDGKNGSVNLVCYEKKLLYGKGNASFCDMKLTPVTIAILKEAINIGNPISAVAAWPFWLVSSYFKIHPADSDKFKAPIFVVKQHNSLEIIALYNGKYVYYRKTSLENLDENAEIDNAIKFLGQLFNTELDDIVIYNLNEETLNTFTMNSSINMKLVSKTADFAIDDKARRASLILKSACSLFFIGLFTNTIFDVVKIFNYNARTHTAEKVMNSIDPGVIDEIATWNSLEDYVPIKHLDVKSQIAEKTKGSSKKLQNVSVKIDEKTKQGTVDIIYEEK